MFEGVRGVKYLGDIAIDDTKLVGGMCSGANTGIVYMFWTGPVK